MPFAERTYSFRAATNLGDRVCDASRLLIEGREDHRLILDLVSRFAADLPDEVAGATEGDRRNQSALIRGLLEAFAAAAEEMQAERQYAAEYAAMARERDAESEAFARAAFAASASLWRDDD